VTQERTAATMHGVAPYPLYWPIEYARCTVRREVSALEIR
jgi:hypothetical protein